MRTSVALSCSAGLCALFLASGAALAGSVSVVIQPAAGGEAAIITKLAFRNCLNAGVNPWNPERCAGWRSLSSGRSAFTGYFCVQGLWGGLARYRRGLDMPLSVPHRDVLISPQPPSQKATCI